MSISIPPVFFKKSGELINAFAKKKKIAKQLSQSVSDPARFAAAMLVTSIVSKDLVGCFLYTTQSLNNKKIPEEKRKFVASLDLMNGILMVGGQFLIGKVIDAKVTPWLKSKFTGVIKDKFTGVEKTVNTNALFHPDNINKFIKNTAKKVGANLENIDIDKIAKQMNKIGRTPFESGFGILVTAIATTALTKRGIVPLISTPLAGWFKNKFLNDKKKPEEEMTPAMVDFTMAKIEPNEQKSGLLLKKSA